MSEKFVKNILDVPGVEGVCVIDREGAPLYNELPPFFVDELFDDLARRVISLYETIDENFVPCDDYLLKYSERWIMLRRSNGIYLLIFCQSDVNRVSLKMVTNLALKNIKPARSMSSPSPTGALPAKAAPAPVQAPVKATEPPPAAPVAAPEPAESEASPTRKRVARARPSRSYRGSSY